MVTALAQRIRSQPISTQSLGAETNCSAGVVLGTGATEGPQAMGRGVPWRYSLRLLGGELEPSKKLWGRRSPEGLRPFASHSAAPRATAAAVPKLPRPSSRQVLAEFSLPPSLRERLHPLSTLQAGAESAAPLPLPPLGETSPPRVAEPLLRSPA